MTSRGTDIPVVETTRLVLRGPLDSDARPLGAFIASPRATWIGGPYPAEDAAHWLDRLRNRWAQLGRGPWIVALKGSNTPIGRVGLLDHEGWHEPELAWFLFEDFEGQGYAHEAALAARAYANGPLGLPPLFSFIEAANHRSRALVQKLGAQHESDTRFKDHDLGIYRHPAPKGST
jgi:RimJ/RimL family protein N-acetyltransferase